MKFGNINAIIHRSRKHMFEHSRMTNHGYKHLRLSSCDHTATKQEILFVPEKNNTSVKPTHKNKPRCRTYLPLSHTNRKIISVQPFPSDPVHTNRHPMTFSISTVIQFRECRSLDTGSTFDDAEYAQGEVNYYSSRKQNNIRVRICHICICILSNDCTK